MAESQRPRLFVAVAVESGVVSALDEAVAPLRAEAPDLSWTKPEQWHLTLAFLGSVDAAMVAAAHEAVLTAAAAVGPFPLALDGTAGTFRGGVLWARLLPSEALAALAASVGAELAGRGFALEDRPFSAHLTLARARRGRRLPRSLVDAFAGPTGSWPVSEVLLVRSHLGGARGSRYETLVAAPLSGGA